MHRTCRFCGSGRLTVFLDLGASPLSNAYLREDQLAGMEPFFPLDVRICEECWLAQLDAVEAPENIFSEYAYFSSFSTTWLAHCDAYAEKMVRALGLGPDHKVIEIASNDGGLLACFVRRGVPVLGVDPARNVAAAAIEKGVPTRVAFWGLATAEAVAAEEGKADLIALNNVLAHVPDINDFAAGLKAALKPGGVITVEFPHLYRLVERKQFDTVYHEHYSYLSFLFVERLFQAHGLRVFDVEELPTHGGSLRVFGCHDGAAKDASPAVAAMDAFERAAGMDGLAYYLGFGDRIAALKRDILRFFLSAKDEGKRVAGYGAPAKGNTLLNYCGIRTDLLEFTVDRNPHKQGLYLPGVRIPIRAPEYVFEQKPDFLFILPWNLQDEVRDQMAGIRAWGGRFAVPIPDVAVLP